MGYLLGEVYAEKLFRLTRLALFGAVFCFTLGGTAQAGRQVPADESRDWVISTSPGPQKSR